MPPLSVVERPGAVFLSYSRGASDVVRFVRQVLEPMLVETLPHHGVVGPLAVFVDESGLAPGSTWPDELQAALLRATVLVPVLTPEYFRRPWCLAEFYTMWGRRERLGIPCIEPVRFSDGDFFPDEARALSWTDVGPHVRARTHRVARAALWNAVDALCARAAALIHAPPIDDPGWTFVVPQAAPSTFLHKPTFLGTP
jgi:hypothetical protein